MQKVALVFVTNKSKRRKASYVDDVTDETNKGKAMFEMDGNIKFAPKTMYAKFTKRYGDIRVGEVHKVQSIKMEDGKAVRYYIKGWTQPDTVKIIKRP